MSNTNTGGPAFPLPGLHRDTYNNGMTLRDYFAAKATDADVKEQVDLLREVSPMRMLPEGWRATCRYMHADAMLKAREA